MSADDPLSWSAGLLVVAWLVILTRGVRAVAEDAVGDAPAAWPDIVAIVPARDEAAVIARSVGSLLAQDYPGRLRVILIDDHSSDGTSEIARALAPSARSEHLPPAPALTVLPAPALTPGWTGKLAAVAHGIAHAGEPAWLWLTDADIAHSPETLRALVAMAARDRLVLNSRMALLRTASFAERAIVPAFVYFFRLLYPFTSVNDPRSGTAAAAGGCMLVDRAALARAGGIAAMRGALIDDVTMGKLMKRHGPIHLALSHATVSLRASDWHGLWTMIARSAYAQLRFSPWLLGGAVMGILLLFWGPLVVTIAVGWRGVGALLLMLLSFAPMLRFYRQSPLWTLALPMIALFYAAATLASAVQHWRGKGGMWKGRAQAMAT